MDALTDQLQDSLGEDFEIVRPVGGGDVASVFLARERALDRPVAVKVLRPAVARDETARKRFLREARLAARIHHPNVVAVHRVGELSDGGLPYLVMEYIDGRSFSDILAAEGPLEEEEARRVVTEVAAALEAAHALGIIHRDVCPSNILRTRDAGRIVLTDFGLAGVLETGGEAVTRLTQAGEIIGNVHYAAPEQLEGKTVLPGSDVYALAVTAYELLTAGGPFPEAKTAGALIRAHVEATPKPLRSARPDISPGMEDLLLRCLHKRPEHRPSARLLKRRLSGEAGDDGQVHSFLAELKRRNVYRVGAAYGAFILVVLAFVDAALPALPFAVPDWTDTVLVMGAIAGLPLALVLGWLFDLTGRGVERTPSLLPGAPAGQRLLQAAALALILALTALLGWLFLLR